MSDKARKKKYIQNLDEQVYHAGKSYWRVSRLLKLTENLKAFKMPIKHLNIYNLYPEINTTIGFVDHVKRVNSADLSCPIILDDEGYVMDGRHRIAKALMKEKKNILAVRFEKTPPHCYVSDDGKD